MELCLIDWRGVWSQPYHTLTYLPSLLSQKNLLNIPKKQFTNVMSYLCQIQVTKLHSWEWWTVQQFQSTLFRQNPSITKSSLRIQLSRCAQCKKGDSCACWAFWSGPSAKKLHLWISLQHETWTRGKIETRLWKVHDNLCGPTPYYLDHLNPRFKRRPEKNELLLVRRRCYHLRFLVALLPSPSS